MKKFKDHFSTQSLDYSKYRPTYPAELFEFIIQHTKNRETAWDTGTGNGQAALEIAKHFKRVIATDPSEAQTKNAIPAKNIEYKVASAENSGLPDKSIDLITVAQAYHWFNHEKFIAEARRLAKKDATIAVWGYELCKVNPSVDKVFMRYYRDILEDYWPPERKHVEESYAHLPFPFENAIYKEFSMSKNWNLYDFLAYLSTWSAAQKYIKAKGENPLDLVKEDFQKAWGKASGTKQVAFPVFLHLGNL